MIGMKLKRVVYALTMASAISNAGCSVEGAVDGALHEAYPAPQLGGADNSAPGAADYSTHAETRHFAIYNRYRAMVDTSGGNGAGTTGSAFGAEDDGSDNLILWGGRLLGIEHMFCPADGGAK